MGFLHKYVRLRGKCQESMYNIGRAFHQLGNVVTGLFILYNFFLKMTFNYI